MLNVNLQHIKIQFFFSPETVEKIKFCPSLSARNRETTKVDSRFSFYSCGKLAHQQVEKEAQRKKLRGKNKCFIFAVKKFYDYET